MRWPAQCKCALYQMPGIAATMNFAHSKRPYYESHRMINPTAILPIGPLMDLARPHDRDRLDAAASPDRRSSAGISQNEIAGHLPERR